MRFIVITTTALLTTAAWLPPTPVGACEPCQDQLISGQWYHHFPQQPPPGGDLYSDGHEALVSGTCAGYHSLCLAVSELDLAALRTDAEAREAAVASNPAVVLNTLNRTVDVLNCHGEVWESIPIGTEQFEHLRAEITQ